MKRLLLVLVLAACGFHKRWWLQILTKHDVGMVGNINFTLTWFGIFRWELVVFTRWLIHLVMGISNIDSMSSTFWWGFQVLTLTFIRISRIVPMLSLEPGIWSLNPSGTHFTYWLIFCVVSCDWVLVSGIVISRGGGFQILTHSPKP